MGYIWFRAGKMGFFLVFFPWEFLERTAGVEGRKLRKSQNFFGIRTPILEFFWEFLGIRARSVPAFPSSGSGMEEIENPQVFMGIKPQSWNILGIFFWDQGLTWARSWPEPPGTGTPSSGNAPGIAAAPSAPCTG